MSRLYALFIIAAALLATTDAHLTKGANQIEGAELASRHATPWPRSLKLDNGENLTKRSLRTVDTTDAVAEERGIQSVLYSALSKFTKGIKLKGWSNKLQIKAWLKAKLDPNDVYAILGYKGKPLKDVEPLPGYQLWLDFGEAWRKAGGRYQ